MKVHHLHHPLAALAGAVLAACSQAPVKLPVAFDQAEAKALMAPGTNQISGKIIFEPDQGHVLAFPDTVVTCEGHEVSLIPDTDYAREWALSYFGKPVTDMAYRLTKRGSNKSYVGYEAFVAQTRKTQCDENGQFSFSNVANGDFFVLARVRWLGKDEEIYKFGFASEDIDEEDGVIIKKIRLQGNQKVQLNGPWP
jgi:hypothetical protein